MVTIIPIDVDQDLVREGLALAIAERVTRAVLQIQKQANELRADGLLRRENWERAFTDLDAIRAEAATVLDYAQVFDDQQPVDGDAEG
jgi:hypothetical protein